MRGAGGHFISFDVVKVSFQYKNFKKEFKTQLFHENSFFYRQILNIVVHLHLLPPFSYLPEIIYVVRYEKFLNVQKIINVFSY